MVGIYLNRVNNTKLCFSSSSSLVLTLLNLNTVNCHPHNCPHTNHRITLDKQIEPLEAEDEALIVVTPEEGGRRRRGSRGEVEDETLDRTGTFRSGKSQWMNTSMTSNR